MHDTNTIPAENDHAGAPLDFRLRFWIFLTIFVLGFIAPWDWALHVDGRGPNAHAWGLLAVNLAKVSGLRIDGAFNVILSAAILCAVLGAILRTAGSASLGPDVMRSAELRGDAVVASGPYRFLRNPLYLGTLFTTLAVAVLMPASGAVFTILAVVLFELRLIFAEESFLKARLGTAYAEYCAKVPRIVPALRPYGSARSVAPRWGQALLAEIFPWGIALTLAVLGWRYNAGLLIQGVLVSLGVSLVVRAFVMPAKREIVTEK